MTSQWKIAKFLGSLSLTHDVIAGIKMQDVAEVVFTLTNRAPRAQFLLYGSLPQAAVDQQ